MQDKQYLVSFAQLPEGATLDRTEAVIRKMSDIALKEPGVDSAVAFPGLSINGFINSPSAGIVFVTLKPFDERKAPICPATRSRSSCRQKFAGINDAFIAIFPPPPVQGLGTIGGFKLQVEDRADQGDAALNQAMQQIQMKARQDPGACRRVLQLQHRRAAALSPISTAPRRSSSASTCRMCSTRCRSISGSLYVNDFNRFGRTYQVIAQADTPFRAQPDDILRLQDAQRRRARWCRWARWCDVSETTGPDSAMRYNGFRAADINGGPAPGYSTGQAQAAITQMLDETLPKGMSYEWTELTYQQILAGNTALLVFPLCVLLVFLVLAAQYESLFLPLAIILIVPMCLFSRDHRRVADRRRQQHLHPDRPVRAGRPGLQERHPDRRVRARAGDPGHAPRSTRRSRRRACGCARS